MLQSTLLRFILCFSVVGSSLCFSLDDILLREDFQIRSYTNQTVPGARSLALSHSRSHNSTIVYVSTRSLSSVYAVVDKDNDGVADSVTEVISDQWRPNGIAWRNNSLFVATVTQILRYDNVDSFALAGKKFRRPVLIRDGFPETIEHDWKYMKFSSEGKLFIAVGIRCNICKSRRFGTVHDGSIMTMNPDGSNLKVFAKGLRNSVGFDWHPITRDFWFTENGADGMGDNLPDDVLYRTSEKGNNFGFPYCHIRGFGNPERRSVGNFGIIRDELYGRQCKVKEQIRPVQALGPHVAALGMRFYTAEHGSHDRSDKIGYRVVNVQIAEDNITSKRHEIFAQGWLDGQVGHGEPVDVEVLPDGSLLVSDDVRGDIYRITYK